MTESAPRRSLRVLHLDDSPSDHEHMIARLQSSGLDVRARRVETRAGFEAALAQGGWDAVLSEFELRDGFSGLRALERLRAGGHRLPFIVVADRMDEERIVQAMRLGASDCLGKKSLARLAATTLQAIETRRAEDAKRQADAALVQSTQRLHELARHLQASVEAERAAMALRLHDDVVGSLTALRFELGWLARHVPDPAVQQRVATSIETLGHAFDASRRMMHKLRPALLEEGLVAALQWMTRRFESRTGIVTVFRSSDESLELPPGVSLVVCRIAQEALTNVFRHAQARRVDVDLMRAGGVLSLEIGDDGRGLAPADLAKDGAFGIRGLHERAGTVGGWIELGRGGSGSGTTLILSIPLDPAEGFEDAGAAVRRPAATEVPVAGGPRRAPVPTLWGDL